MKTLQILEEKLISLVGLVNDLKKKNSVLQEEKENALALAQQYQAVGEKLEEENNLLLSKLVSAEASLLHDVKQIEVLSSEKEFTKSVVDDLIKSIDSLVELEKQP